MSIGRSERVATFNAALSGANQAIIRATNRLQLCQEICRICVETGHAMMAYIGFVDDEQCFKAVAYAGPEPELLADFKIHVGPSAHQPDGPIATALREERVNVCDDFRGDPRTRTWHALAKRLGIASSIAVPIRERGRVSGALALYMDSEAFFDAATAQLVDSVAHNLSFALDNLHREHELQQAIAHEHAGHERFRRVFAAMPGYTSISDLASGAIVEVNAIVCRSYGYTREQMLGRTWVELGVGMPQEDRARLYETLTREGSINDFATRVQVRSGEWRDVLVYGERIEFKGRDCVLAVATDITERKALEAAQAASRAKTEFLSRMSHELRTPLNAVLGFTELMLRDRAEPPSPKQAERLGLVHDAGWHLLELIDDVLDLSHIEAGRLQVDIKPLELGPLLDAVVSLTQTVAQRAGVAVQARHVGEAPRTVLSDALRLRQILVNLVSNAVKYNRPGGSVCLEVAREGDRVLVSVVDDGLGMSAEQVNSLFQPFNRAGRERSGIEGSGIGLALSRHLAQLLGGEIRVDSELGKGTRMTLVLPGN
ncbi:MAG TPA: ATP-binding protein [Albitalea sp.]|nr:ATP-binding protein [Albitalea sp.]